MKELVAVIIGILLFVAIIVGGISYNNYINRNKEHVYTAQETYAIECAKRGGNVITETGRDTAGSKDVRVQEFKCEGATDVRN